MSALKLKPSEISFWQQIIVSLVNDSQCRTLSFAIGWADSAVRELRERIEDPGPRPDEGRL